jgi:hypothetical protein
MACRNPVEQRWPERPHARGLEARLAALVCGRAGPPVAAWWPGMPAGLALGGAAGVQLGGADGWRESGRADVAGTPTRQEDRRPG